MNKNIETTSQKSGRRDSFSIGNSTLSCMEEGTRFLDLSLVRMVNE